MKDINLLKSIQNYCESEISNSMGLYDYVPGINQSYDSGTPIISNATLYSGANFPYFYDRKLITNTSPRLSPVFLLVDGSLHPILASGNLLGRPFIKAYFLPSLKSNFFWYISICGSGCCEYFNIKSDKIFIIESGCLPKVGLDLLDPFRPV